MNNNAVIKLMELGSHSRVFQTGATSNPQVTCSNVAAKIKLEIMISCTTKTTNTKR